MKIEHINFESEHKSHIVIADGENHMNLHFKKPGMTISLNRHEAQELDKAVTFAIQKILSHSRYAVNRGKMLRKSVLALKHRFEKLGFVDEKGNMRELTPLEMDFYEDDSFREWTTDWLYGISGWGKSNREFIEKALGETSLAIDDSAWALENSNFDLIDDEAKIDCMFQISNASSLVGLTKPEYIHNGNIDLIVSDWSIKISLKGDDAAMLMSYFYREKKLELEAASTLWARLSLIQRAFKLFKDSFKENGLDSDGDYINADEVDPSRLSKEFTALFNAVKSPLALQAFVDDFADKEKPSSDSVTISFN